MCGRPPTCSNSFYSSHLSHVQLQPLNNILKIECADGNLLPYNGFIEVSISAPGVPDSSGHQCLLLVVPDTPYNKNTPILLGTNIISAFLDDCKLAKGEQFLQKRVQHLRWERIL